MTPDPSTEARTRTFVSSSPVPSNYPVDVYVDGERLADIVHERDTLAARLCQAEERETEIRVALRDELMPLVKKARLLADDKNLAAAEVFHAVTNVDMWLRAALAASSAGETPE